MANVTSSKQITISMLIILLGLCLITKAKQFDEADCRPRPTAVAIDDSNKYKPYHIVLYRCSGTYNKVSPSIKTCTVREQESVLVHAIDEHGVKIALTVKNHTKCGAQCTISTCKSSGMIMDDCRCRCLIGDCGVPDQPVIEPSGVVAPVAGERDGNSNPSVPYMVGMALVGLFAVFVLVFDATLYIKKNGFIYTIKHSCCGRAPTVDRNENLEPVENQTMVRKEINSIHSDV